MRISDWSSDVCSSDLAKPVVRYEILPQDRIQVADIVARADDLADAPPEAGREIRVALIPWLVQRMVEGPRMSTHACIPLRTPDPDVRDRVGHSLRDPVGRRLPVLVVRILDRSEEHTSELQSLMRISYAVFCLKKKNN